MEHACVTYHLDGDLSAARARMSAYETTPGQASSSAALTASTTWKPRAEPLFGGDVFSDGTPGTLSSSSDASQP
jgi:hypothetical protein